MTYELAKELKDAGFPFRTNMDDPKIFADIGVAPTLPELIEACGDKIYDFIYEDINKTQWRARARWITHGETGSTPEEAVARLWLALNKK